MLAGYLYLFYGDYVGENGNPYSIITGVKENIKREALQKFQIAYNSSAEIEQAFEKKYKLKSDEFGRIDFLSTKTFADANASMSDFDAAISELKKLISDGGTVKKMEEEGRKAVLAIDDLLMKGAQLGGLTDGAYSQLEDGLKRLRHVRSLIRYTDSRNNQKDEILDAISDVESNVSGYMLELSSVYGSVGASQYGLEKNHEVMINIGSNTLGENVFKTYKEDPQILADLQKLSAALASNNGVQSKADSVINMHMEDGNGSVSTDVTWVGFQEKNYRDISSIPLVKNKMLGELGIFSYYDSDMLVNIAGSFGNNYQKNGIFSKNMMRYSNIGQGEIDKIWNEVKNSMKLLIAADAIAGEMNNNFTNKVNYYVIRRKGDGEVRVIGVSRILDKIATAFMTGENSSLGINWGTNITNTQYTNRSKYWSVNAENFQKKSGPLAGPVRSAGAYQTIWSLIYTTKISISLNFSSFFN